MNESKEEEWRDIKNHPGYQVSNTGKIRSYHNNRYGVIDKPHYLKTDYNASGYERGCLGSKNREFVHRLVASAFIPNINDEPVVRHLDDNRKNNNYKNLAWGSQSENIKDCISHGRFNSNIKKAKEAALKMQRKSVVAISLDNDESKTFSSLSEAAEILNLNRGNISNVLSGRQHKTGNYTFRYKKDGDSNEYN